MTEKDNFNMDTNEDSTEINNDFSDFDEILVDTEFDSNPDKDKPKKLANKGLTLLTISIVGVLVMSFILTGLLFSLSSGETEGGVLALLGISSLSVLSFLKLSFTLVFSLSALVGLLFLLINLFAYTQLDFAEIENRKKKFKNVIFGGVTFLVSIVLAFLISMFWSTSAVPVTTSEVIETNLESTLNLTAPISVTIFPCLSNSVFGLSAPKALKLNNNVISSNVFFMLVI